MAVRFRSNARELADRMERRAVGFAVSETQAAKDAAIFMRAKAEELSGTRYMSLKEMRQVGHPYARRHLTRKGRRRTAPPLPAPAYVINKQGGQFYSSWQTGVKTVGRHILSLLRNAAPHAKYLTAEGTTKMIGRPISERVLFESRDTVYRLHLGAKRQNERRR